MNLYTFFSFVATPLGHLLNLINGFCGDYGIAIIIFTLIVRGCLFPLYASQIKGQMKMADIQPKMQAIQKKYAGNREELGRKMQELYKEEKYNPMSGCLPLVIQMPILMGLFYLLRNPGMYVDKTSLIIASHESFLWIPDLSQPDSWILPIITGITTFASMSMTGMMGTGMPTAGAAGSPDMGAQMQPMMKVMRVFMPVFIVVMARSMPSGLAVYWFIGNLFTVIQTWLLKNMRKKAHAAHQASKGLTPEKS
ncbi:MAG: YidC/Oxa1 family membrane protein insertase [Clostridiales Family XIII bacterium]|nr:YidC/Oxa1 family membrane protein insertase [Clostridiales Family XIII bacterium]